MNWVYLALLNWCQAGPLDVRAQPNAKHPSSHDVLRPLTWGDINFVSTTDTHGWLAGHILEGQFSGDWGDFVSFGEHMHRIADDNNVDLIIIDCGDRHDGNGLSDASKQDGSLALPIFCEQDYDVVTVGNHELYRGTASLQEFHKIRKHFGDRYVVSNVEVAVGRTWVPLGNKYRVFTTKNQGLKVLAFGFMFNFEGNDKEVTRVTKVEDEIQKPWFQKVLKEVVPSIDYIALVGHIPLRDFPEFDYIMDAIRAVNKDVPISIFGGHSHVRDARKFDDRAVAIQAGRYVETIGWSSTNLTTYNFSRSFIDFNQRSMAFHSGFDEISDFLTERGVEVSHNIKKARAKLNLDEHKADVPQNFYTDRAPFPSPRSIYSLIQERVLPLLSSPSEVGDKTRYILLNTGAVRFDLFKGPYTKDTGYILSPFKNEWFYIDNVPRHIADQILPIINGYDRVLAAQGRYVETNSHVKRQSVIEGAWQSIEESLGLWHDSSAHGDNMHGDNVHGDTVSDNSHGDCSHGDSLRKRPSYGYRTVDDLGDDGDDTIHTPWKFHPIPNAFQTIVEGNGTGPSSDNEKVVLIFHDFVASFVQSALSTLGEEDLYDPKYHGGEELIDLLPQHFNI